MERTWFWLRVAAVPFFIYSVDNYMTILGYPLF
jgi:hypothetical protein